MIILGIETSCDDTCAALLEIKRGGFRVLSNIISSQAKIHSRYGGVVPELAARQHIQNIIPVIDAALNPPPSQGGGRGRVEKAKSSKQSSCNPHPTLPLGGGGSSEVGAIAVTTGPGLITSLMVGVETAKALSFAWNKPLIGVNHIEGHIYSSLLPSVIEKEPLGYTRSKLRDRSNLEIASLPLAMTSLKFPAIALIVSGGHTELILMTGHGQYKLLGRTRDDAAGECFDKAAKMLGLGYPGGPLISKLAEKGNPDAFVLPRPMTETDNFEFSFSGLKNAIRLLAQNLKYNPVIAREPLGYTRSKLRDRSNPEIASPRSARLAMTKNNKLPLNDLAASVEQAIIDVLVNKSLLAARKYNPKSFILAGGVSANKKLRQTLSERLPKSIKFLLPAQEYTQDNAAMIAAAAYRHFKNRTFANPYKLTASANWELI